MKNMFVRTIAVMTTVASLGCASVSADTLSYADIAEKCMPSMVSITNTSVTNLRDLFGNTYFDFDFFFNEDTNVQNVSAGTGFIMEETDDGYLIGSNAHVVDNATELSVSFVDDTAASAEVVGIDRENDLAVIKVLKDEIEDETEEKITPLEIGSSDDLRVGEEVVAIGNALGYGQSVSAGIVSAKNRDIRFTENGSPVEMSDMIQTDASINPGNSGGALLNMSGELIGINSVKTSSTEIEGVGYAIAIDKALPILKELASGTEDTETEETDGVKLGIMCYTTGSSYPEGVCIEEITEGSVAEKAGMKVGDIIVGMEDRPVRVVEELISMLKGFHEGDSVTFKVKRPATDAFGKDTYQEGEVAVTF